MKQLLFFSILITFTSCLTNKVEQPSLRNYFTMDYIKELEPIITYFEERISNNCNNDQIFHCYINHCKKVEEQLKDGSFRFDTSGISKLLTKSKIYSDLWTLSVATEQLEFNGEIRKKKFLNLNPNGLYFKFLEKRCSEEKMLSNYFKSIQQLSGDIGPTAFATMINNCKHLNFEDPTIRTIYAINWIMYYYNYL